MPSMMFLMVLHQQKFIVNSDIINKVGEVIEPEPTEKI